MGEPSVQELEERLANDFARLGFRAGTHNRRALEEHFAPHEFVEEPAEASGVVLGSVPDLAVVHELLMTIVGRLDWIDASLADSVTPAAAREGADDEVLWRLGRVETRIDAVGELLIAASPEVATLAPESVVMAMHRQLMAVLDASAAATTQLRRQQLQLEELTSTIEDLRRRLDD